MKRVFDIMARVLYCTAFCTLLAGLISSQCEAVKVCRLQGEMAGEVTDTSVILQSRLTGCQRDWMGDVPGAAGYARFEVSADPGFVASRVTKWIEAGPDTDFIIKSKVEGLSPGSLYYYRLVFGKDRDHARPGPARSFKTLPGPAASEEVRFAVVTGMNYYRFHNGPRKYKGADKELGYPALDTILEKAPDFMVATGDNVYYDHGFRAMTLSALRRKWHKQFAQERFLELFAKVPVYWEKDDHDFRYDDADNTGVMPPGPELGKRVFIEQVPVAASGDPGARTYRTRRVTRELQVWFLEGRDFRSPNNMPDGPGKSLWGEEQREWLKETLMGSDAAFKIVVSPTPLIGPDDKRKRDNHTDLRGFRHERDSFFSWAKEEGFLDKGLYFVCGDRHWQYHSVHPSGFDEFSCGALVDANSRLGVKPGDKNGSDPEAEIRQPYTSNEPSGGFLYILVRPAEGSGARAEFDFCDEAGELLYSATKHSRVQGAIKP